MAQEVNRRLQNIVIVDTFYARQTFHTINNLINLLNTCLHEEMDLQTERIYIHWLMTARYYWLYCTEVYMNNHEAELIRIVTNPQIIPDIFETIADAPLPQINHQIVTNTPAPDHQVNAPPNDIENNINQILDEIDFDAETVINRPWPPTSPILISDEE